MTGNDPLAFALAYAQGGWRVFPVHSVKIGSDGVARCDCANFMHCNRPGKHPHIQSWQTDATTDADKIREWWKQWPTANVGLATGEGSEVWAFDVDPAKGGDGSLAELEREHGRLPQSVEAITGSGGRHLLYRHPGIPLANRQNVRPGLDVRGDGGYIIVAPSLHASGGRYEWDQNGVPGLTPIADAPPWLLELVLSRPESPAVDPASGVAPDNLPPLETRFARAERYLRGIPGAVAGQAGHAQTWQAALVLVRGFALPNDEALGLLERDYNPRCEPPWSRRELEHKIRSAAADGRRPLGYLLARPVDAPPSPDDYDDEERSAIKDEHQAEAPEQPHRLTPAERALRLGATGVRLPTGIKTLDEATRGGPLTGRVIAVGGAPGAGKTGFITQWARTYSQAGYHVAILAADEEADGLLLRWGQLEGFAREELEEGNAQTKEALSSLMASEHPRLILAEGDDEPETIERVAADLAEQAQGEPAILFVDSIQMARAQGTDDAKPARERTDAIVKALKRASKRLGLLVVATSELSRGAYRAKQAKDNINSLAAFKESGGIEYGVTMAIVMVPVADEEGLIDVGIPKNRLGKKPSFRLKQNFRLCQFTEVPLEEPADEREEDPDDKEERLIAKAKEKILRKLAECSSLTNKHHVCVAAGGRVGITKKAYDQLLAEGRIALINGSIRTVSN